MTTILVTGGTGNNGKAVLEHLARTDLSVRAMLRDPTKAIVKAPNINYIQGDFDDIESLDKVLEGVDTAFLVSAYGPNFREQHLSFSQAAKKAGVKLIVQLSGYGADHTVDLMLPRWLGEAEKHLKTSGVDWAILRPSTYSSNFFGSAETISKEGVIAVPFGPSPGALLNLIDNRDVGAVAAEILARPAEHRRKTYTLTGTETLNHDQIASIFSKVLSKKVVYQPVSSEDGKASLLQWNVPELIADALIAAFESMGDGYLSNIPVTTDVECILGRKPLSFEQFVRDHTSMFNA